MSTDSCTRRKIPALGKLAAAVSSIAISSFASAAFAQNTAAVAQSTPAAGAPTPATNAANNAPANQGEIIVTAQRKAERLSRVPVSVVAYAADALQTRNIVSEQDVGRLVPGLQVKNGQNSNQLSFSMRGQTLDPFSGTSPAVLTYLNEAPYNPGNTATAFFDLQSIQVLKGPQGTLFGRNATGGAVLYSTPEPGDVVNGFVILRGGSRNFYQGQAAVDLPILPGVLALRVAGDVTKGDGYIRNLNTGNTLGDKDSQSGRLTLKFTPSSTIKNVTVLQYARVRGTEGEGGIWTYNSAPTCVFAPGGCAGVPLAVQAASQFTSDGTTHVPNTSGQLLTDTLDLLYGHNDGPAAPGQFPGGVEGYTKFAHDHPYEVWLQYDLPHRAHNTFASNTTEIQLGRATKLKNIVSYMKGYANTPGNLAGGPFGGLWLFNLGGVNATGVPGGENFRSTFFSEELQLQGRLAGDRLNYTAGVFYSHQKRRELVPIDIGEDLSFGPVADISYAYRNRETSKAVFAQMGYQLTDQLTVNLGGRYTWVNVGIVQDPGNVFGIDPNSPAADQSKNFSAPSWTFNLQYQIDPRNMVYVSQRGSFRSGNLNGTVAPFTDPLTGRPANLFGNEYLKDLELGYKFAGHVGGRPASFNIAGYYSIVTHAQHALYAIVGGNPAGFSVNVPQAKVKGVEVDGLFGLNDWVDVGFNGAYTDAKYTKANVPIPFVGSLPVDSYPDSPKFAGSAFVDLKLPVDPSLGAIDLRAEAYGQTHTFFSSTNGTSTPGTRLPGYTTLNARLGWANIMRSHFSAAVFVRNLTDKLYYVSGYALGASSGLNTAYPGEPRTFGAELSVKF